jgi:putative ABC transport system permease protein
VIRAVRLLNLRRLRRQPLRAGITVVAVAAGVSLAVTIVVVMTSLNRSLEDFGRTVAGPTPLRVIGVTTRGGLDESVLPKVRAVRGVEAAVPVVQTVVLTQGREANLPIVAFGVDCSIEAVLGSISCSPDAVATARLDAPPLISQRLARRLGPDGAVQTDIARIPLAGAPASEELDRLNDGRVAIFPLPVAQQHFVRGTSLDIIYVKPVPGTPLGPLRQRLQAAVGSWNKVMGAADLPPQAGVVQQIYVPLFGMLALLALGIGAVLVYNTMMLSLEERRRQLAITGALGAPRRLLLGGALLEAATLGLLGGIVGAVAARFVASYVVKGMNSSFTEKILGVPISVHLTPTAAVAGVLMGTVLAVVASIVPVRRALRADVSAELSNRDLREERAPRALARRAAIWLVLALVGLGVTWLAQRNGGLEPWQGTAAPAGFALAAIALLVATAALAPLVIKVLLRRGPLEGAPFRLGLANLVRDPGRTGIMAAAVAAAVSIAFTVGSFNRTIRGLTLEEARDYGDVVRVSTLDANNTVNIDSRTPPDVINALRHLPGVRSVDRSAALAVGTDPGDIHGVEGDDKPSLVFDMIRGSKDLTRLAAGEVIIGPTMARNRGLRPGDQVRLATPRGYVSLPIMGVVQDGDFGGRKVTMSLPLLERLYGPQPPTNVEVRPQPGVTTDELARRIRAANLHPDLQVDTPDELAVKTADDVNQLLSPLWVIQRALLLVSFIAVLSTLLLVGAQRRRELGMLAAVGMQPRELSTMVFTEAGAVGVAGSVLALMAGLGICIGLMAIIPIVVGFKGSLLFEFRAFPIYAALAVAVVVAAAAWPAWRTSRVEVLDAIRYE